MKTRSMQKAKFCMSFINRVSMVALYGASVEMITIQMKRSWGKYSEEGQGFFKKGFNFSTLF